MALARHGRPEFASVRYDELYIDSGVWFGTYGGFPARQLAASTRWRRGKLFGGSLRPLAGQRLAELGDGGGDDDDSGNFECNLITDGQDLTIFFSGSWGAGTGGPGQAHPGQARHDYRVKDP